jgi:hypothetical protein
MHCLLMFYKAERPITQKTRELQCVAVTSRRSLNDFRQFSVEIDSILNGVVPSMIIFLHDPDNK